jgi:hypothetical protein
MEAVKTMQIAIPLAREGYCAYYTVIGSGLYSLGAYGTLGGGYVEEDDEDFNSDLTLGDKRRELVF